MTRWCTSHDSQIHQSWLTDTPFMTRRCTNHNSRIHQLWLADAPIILRPGICSDRRKFDSSSEMIIYATLANCDYLPAWVQWNSCPLIRPMTSCHFSTFGSAYRSWPRHNIGLMNACSDAMHHTQEQTLWASIGQWVMTISGWAPITKVFLYFPTIGSWASNANAAIISSKRVNSLFLV